MLLASAACDAPKFALGVVPPRRPGNLCDALCLEKSREICPRQPEVMLAFLLEREGQGQIRCHGLAVRRSSRAGEESPLQGETVVTYNTVEKALLLIPQRSVVLDG